MWVGNRTDVSYSDVVSEDPHWIPFLRQVVQACQAGGRKAAQRVLENAPCVRTKESGPVRLRDGVDYSIRYARVGGKFSFQAKLPGLVAASRGTVPVPPRFPDLCFHNCMELVRMNDAACERWTIYAESIGARFDGQHGYIFPGKRKKEFYGKLDFKSNKAEGLIPTHKRSEAARVRRAERRRKPQTAMPLKRSWTQIHVKEPVVVRPSITCRAMREEWRPLKSEVRFRDFRLRKVESSPPVSCLNVGKRCVRLNEMGLKAIERIYSRSILVPKNEISYDQTTDRTYPFRWRVKEPPSGLVSSMEDYKAGTAFKITVDASTGRSYKTYIGGHTSLLS